MDTLDLSGTKLKKLNKPNPNEAQTTVLILDDNELQRLDNIDSFTKVQKLSLVRNQLLRMYGVCRLHALHTLNLAHNGILTIEGLKELVHLKHLCLAGNSIKTMEHLQTNINLEHLDLSENNIINISDLSFLKNLKELLLNGNRIGHLRQCERYLPSSLVTLTLASNNISDLNEISQLVHLTALINFSIVNNPCVNMTGNYIGFDYRPFIINWCVNVKVIDGYVVDAIESLRGEWLYSQGRGRHFRVGDHQALTQYLASVCPLSGETLETEEDRKLRLILSKAQHHQQQLREQLSTNGSFESLTPSPASRRRIHSNRSSPRPNSSRLGVNRNKSPDKMTTSCYVSSGSLDNSIIMSQSLDPKMLSQSTINQENDEPVVDHFLSDEMHSPLKAATKLVPVPESLMSPDYRPSNSLVNRLTAPQHQQQPQPIAITAQINNTSNNNANSKQNLSRKDHLATSSPKLNRYATRPRSTNTNSRNNQSPPLSSASPLSLRKSNQGQVPRLESNDIMNTKDESGSETEMCALKLQTIRNIALERSMKKASNENENAAAVIIQKTWRGYYTRNCHKKTVDLLRTMQSHRTQEHIQQLAMDMESTKVALENERKIQMLQMQAINALWKKISAIQSNNATTAMVAQKTGNGFTNDSTEVVKDLAQTCSILNTQVQQLQNSMQDVMRYMSTFCQIPPFNNQQEQPTKEIVTGTQTEIVAVHTPQGEAGKMFPFQKTPRPSSLPLPVSQRAHKPATNPNQTNAAPHEVKQFAGTLVDGVIKIVAETSKENQTTEITVTDTDLDRTSKQNDSLTEDDENDNDMTDESSDFASVTIIDSTSN